MTREEAIDVFDDNFTVIETHGHYTDEEIEQARQMAIKSLEQEQEPCEDCVSRKELLKYNTVCMDDSGINRFCVPTQIVRTLPSVMPTRKKGEWCKQNDDYFDWYECSECGYGSEGEMQYSSECDVRTNYCPNCGAEMQEVEE